MLRRTAVRLAPIAVIAAVATGAMAQDVRPLGPPLPADVLGVMPTSDGSVVLLRVQGRDIYVPIWIGDAEALAIQLRLAKQTPARPLTHDLLESVIREAGARVTRVEVVEVRGGVFHGRVTLRTRRGLRPMDARSSDSIALALGAGVPVYVWPSVIAAAGVDRDTLLDRGYEGSPVPSNLRRSL